MAVFDAASLTPISGSPFAGVGRIISVAVDSVNDKVYTANFTNNSFSVFDAATMSLLSTVPTPGSAYAIAYDPTTNHVLVVCNSTNNLAVFDAATLMQVPGSPFSVGNSPRDVEVE